MFCVTDQSLYIVGNTPSSLLFLAHEFLGVEKNFLFGRPQDQSQRDTKCNKILVSKMRKNTDVSQQRLNLRFASTCHLSAHSCWYEEVWRALASPGLEVTTASHLRRATEFMLHYASVSPLVNLPTQIYHTLNTSFLWSLGNCNDHLVANWHTRKFIFLLTQGCEWQLSFLEIIFALVEVIIHEFFLYKTLRLKKNSHYLLLFK